MFFSDGHDVPSAFVLPMELAMAMTSNGVEVPFEKGQLIVSNHAFERDVFWIKQGKVQVTLFAPSGRETILRIIGEGHCFGEMSAIDGERRSANVTALTDGMAIRLSGPAFVDTLRRSTDLSFWLLRQYTRQIRELTDRVFQLTTYSVGMRLHSELLRLVLQAGTTDGQCILRNAPTHAELAARIGTNRESVTRELRTLATAGILQQKGRSLTILDAAALRDLVAQNMG